MVRFKAKKKEKKKKDKKQFAGAWYHHQAIYHDTGLQKKREMQAAKAGKVTIDDINKAIDDANQAK